MLLPKIVDCARTGRRPRKFERHRSKYPHKSVNVDVRSLRAPRANLVFCTDEKRIRTENKVLEKGKDGLGFYPGSTMRRDQASGPDWLGCVRHGY